MRRILTTAVLLAAAVPLGLLKSTPAHGEEGMQVSPDASRPSAAGSPEFFTGDVLVKPLFNPTEYTKTGGGQVTFSPCARSAWHTHPAGQTLIVTSGTGWVQQWGGEKQQLKPGDVIWTPPGVMHWHGATATDSMTHIAIQDSVDGRNVDWMEKVADDEYMS